MLKKSIAIAAVVSWLFLGSISQAQNWSSRPSTHSMRFGDGWLHSTPVREFGTPRGPTIHSTPFGSGWLQLGR